MDTGAASVSAASKVTNDRFKFLNMTHLLTNYTLLDEARDAAGCHCYVVEYNGEP